MKKILMVFIGLNFITAVQAMESSSKKTCIKFGSAEEINKIFKDKYGAPWKDLFHVTGAAEVLQNKEFESKDNFKLITDRLITESYKFNAEKNSQARKEMASDFYYALLGAAVIKE